MQPLLHMLLLTWAHSGHYNTSTRLVALLRLIVEDLIRQCRVFLPGSHAHSALTLHTCSPAHAQLHEHIFLLDFQWWVGMHGEPCMTDK